MFTIQAHSVTDALCQGIVYIQEHGDVSQSRNGPVLVSPVPVTTFTRNPQWRVLSVPGRNDNPFFHLIEALWMLAGRRDLAPLTPIVSRMTQFSDDGGRTQPGAYGYRWKCHFDHDQIEWAVKRLKADPSDRRTVIAMWDPNIDIDAANKGSRDVPCNTHIYLGIYEGRLNLTVCCRSNDLLWGAHGANAVHFSMFQEYLAAKIGVNLGSMWQVSNNYHIYQNTFTEELVRSCKQGANKLCHYLNFKVKPYQLFDESQPAEVWDEDLEMWWRDPTRVGIRHSFFRRVATPVFLSHKAFRDRSDPKRFEKALEIIDQCAAEDWKVACQTWLKRVSRAADDGVQS